MTKAVEPPERVRRALPTVTLMVIVVYVVLRVVQWVLSLPTIDGPDSHSYLPGSGLGVPANGYIGFEKVSFTGGGVLRPWTVTLPYAILATDYLRSIFQLMVSIGAFLLLAFSIVRTTQGRTVGRVLALIALGFSCTTLVGSWDLLMNRESVAISLTVAFIALSLLSVVFRSFRFFVLVMAVALLLTLTRPTLAPLTVLVVLVLIAVRVRQSTTAQAAGGGVGPGTVVRGVLAVAMLVVVVGYPALYSLRLDASWAQWYGQTMSETQFGYVVSDYNPRADELVAALAQTAPTCLLEDLPVYTGDYVGAPWGFAAYVRDSCPEFASWYKGNWPTWYYRYLLAHPAYVAKVSVSGLPIALRPWDATESASPLPVPLRDAVFPVTTRDGVAEYDPFYFYWSILLGAGLAALVKCRTRLGPFVREHGGLIAILGAIAIGSLLSIATNLLLVPSYPLETNRVNVSSSLALRIEGTLLAVLVVWRVIAAVRSRSRLPAYDG